jgi:hypothetical protein
MQYISRWSRLLERHTPQPSTGDRAAGPGGQRRCII